jgi:hypothetical protein
MTVKELKAFLVNCPDEGRVLTMQVENYNTTWAPLVMTSVRVELTQSDFDTAAIIAEMSA